MRKPKSAAGLSAPAASPAAPVAPAAPAAPVAPEPVSDTDAPTADRAPANERGEPPADDQSPPAVPDAAAAAEDLVDAGLFWPALGRMALAGRTLRVRSVSPSGRRRAGRAFAPQPVDLAVDDLSSDEIGALLGDPQLVVEVD